MSDPSLISSNEECPSVEEGKFSYTCLGPSECYSCFGGDEFAQPNNCCNAFENCLSCLAQSQCHDGDYEKNSVLKITESWYGYPDSISDLENIANYAVTQGHCQGTPNEEKQKVRTPVLCNEEKGGRRREKQKRDLLKSIINGAFGGNTASSTPIQRDCAAWCVYNTEGGGHFRWQEDRQCWIKKSGTTCATNGNDSAENEAENNHGKCMKKSLSSFNLFNI